MSEGQSGSWTKQQREDLGLLPESACMGPAGWTDCQREQLGLPPIPAPSGPTLVSSAEMFLLLDNDKLDMEDELNQQYFAVQPIASGENLPGHMGNFFPEFANGGEKWLQEWRKRHPCKLAEPSRGL